MSLSLKLFIIGSLTKLSLFIELLTVILLVSIFFLIISEEVREKLYEYPKTVIFTLITVVGLFVFIPSEYTLYHIMGITELHQLKESKP